MNSIKNIAAGAVLAMLLAAPCAQARQEAAPTPVAAKPQQFVYMLRVMPRLHDQSKWTAKDIAATTEHFERLKKAAAAGQVILGGRTSEALGNTFGLVVFEAENEVAARAFMQADPAVKAGVMSATLHPFEVAMQRKP
jgi:uncharacterized protein YciI